ncbi:GSCOCG00003960001-RA-CDS [Cotesia congregata]|nr:GSCOCG00003960001-RA-CDS [Cotesia congregata]
MEEYNCEKVKLRHKEWRKIVKKERRKRVRQKTAQLRDAEEKQLQVALERSAGYLNWLLEQKLLQEEKERKKAEELAEQEKQWLENEVRAQKEWQESQERKARARAEQLRQEEIIRKEFEEKQEALKKKREEIKRLQDEEINRQVQLEKEIDDYIDNGVRTPEYLRLTSDTHPTKEPCVFFTKTGACKYGDACSRNHQRKSLTKVILIPGFYYHFSLEKNSNEYDTDVGLEFESSETRNHFREFYKDVVPELESFGRIRTLKCCFNSDIHLRGNLYVEYETEREAARAWRKLRSRWYAGRQLNCEFANIVSWRNAVCGMFHCPKGRGCNFIHAFRNPGDEYDIKSPPWRAVRANRESTNSRRDRMEEESRRRDDTHRNWRWSESPEVEMEDISSKKEKERLKSRRRSETPSSRSERHSKGRDSRRDKKTSRRHSSESRYDYFKKKKRRSDKDKENGELRENKLRKKSKEDMARKSRRDQGKIRTGWDTTDSEDSS